MASKDASAAEGTPSLLLRTLDVVSLCVEKPLQLSLGPRAFRLPFTAKMVPSIVYQERNSRAVQGEFGAGGHGLADRVGMIPVNESHRENRMGAKRRKERDLGAGCLCRACQLLGRRFRSEISPPRNGRAPCKGSDHPVGARPTRQLGRSSRKAAEVAVEVTKSSKPLVQKGRFGRLSELAGRNVSEHQAGPENGSGRSQPSVR